MPMSSLHPITGIVLMDEGACDDVVTFDQWIDSLPDKKFLVILCCCVDPTIPSIVALQHKSNVTVYFDYTSFGCQVAPGTLSHKAIAPVGGNKLPVAPGTYDNGGAPVIAYPIPLNDVSAYFSEDIFINTHLITPGSTTHTIYVQQLTATDELTKDLKKVCGADNIIYQTTTNGLQGGNHFMIDNHLLVGSSYLNGLSPAAADTVIRHLYALAGPLQLTIDFIDVQDPAGLLYHLDLMFSCTGMDTHGIVQFFVGQVPAYELSGTAGGPYVAGVQAALDTFAVRLVPVLDGYYPGSYHINRVPLYVGPEFIASGLNGIVDYTGGTLRYYFPSVNMSSVTAQAPVAGMLTADVSMMARVQSDALSVFQTVLGPAHVIPYNVPSHLVIEMSSQSLHCTMGIVSRTD